MVPYHKERQHVTEVLTQAAPVKILTRMPNKHCDPERQHIFMEIRNFLCLISKFCLFYLEMNGLTLLQGVAHIFSNYQYGKERKQ